MVRNHFGNGKKWKVDIQYVNQGKPLGTAHAIKMVERFANKFIVLSGDTVFGQQDIQKIIKNRRIFGGFAFLLYDLTHLSNAIHSTS